MLRHCPVVRGEDCDGRVSRTRGHRLEWVPLLARRSKMTRGAGVHLTVRVGYRALGVILPILADVEVALIGRITTVIAARE